MHELETEQRHDLFCGRLLLDLAACGRTGPHKFRDGQPDYQRAGWSEGGVGSHGSFESPVCLFRCGGSGHAHKSHLTRAGNRVTLGPDGRSPKPTRPMRLCHLCVYRRAHQNLPGGANQNGDVRPIHTHRAGAIRPGRLPKTRWLPRAFPLPSVLHTNKEFRPYGTGEPNHSRTLGSGDGDGGPRSQATSVGVAPRTSTRLTDLPLAPPG